MTSLVLDPAFAEDFVSEPATGAQLTEVFDLVSAELTAAFGFCPTSAEAVRQMLEPPSTGRSVQLLVRERDQGALVQWWGAVRDRGATRFDAQVRTHPRLEQPVGDRLVCAGWTALLDWIRAELLPSQAEAEVHTSMPHGDETAERRLLDGGFTYARTLWNMRAAVADSPPPLLPPAGVTLTTTPDVVAAYRILDSSFTDHFGYESLGFDDWLDVERSMAGHDPSLWVLAEADGGPVAAMIMSRRDAADDALYVQEIATAPAYRRRGIAGLLLRHAFEVARTEGFTKVRLHVDSNNAQGAPALYRRAGFEVRSAAHVFTQTVVRPTSCE